MTEDGEIEEGPARVRQVRFAYDEALATGTDPTRVKRLKTALNEAEVDLVRVKRTRETVPRGHLL